MHRMSCIHEAMWRTCSHASSYIKGAYPHHSIRLIFRRYLISRSQHGIRAIINHFSHHFSITSPQTQPSISTSQHHRQLLYNLFFLISTININISTISDFFFDYRNDISKGRQASSYHKHASSSTTIVFW